MGLRQVRLSTGQVHDALWCSIRAHADAPSGDLVIETEDRGKNVDDYLGREDSDYEHPIRIAAADKHWLARGLTEEGNLEPVGHTDADEAILSLLEKKYGGNFQVSAHLRSCLDDRRIPCTFASWRLVLAARSTQGLSPVQTKRPYMKARPRGCFPCWGS